MQNPNQRPSLPHEVIIQTQENPVPTYPKTKKKKWEDDYKRATFFVQLDTLAAVERIAGNEKGEKTRIINEALQDWLRRNS